MARIPKTEEQAANEGWETVCFAVELGSSPLPDRQLILSKGRQLLAVPCTAVEHISYRFEEAELVRPDYLVHGASNPNRKWIRKSEKLLQLRRSQIETKPLPRASGKESR